MVRPTPEEALQFAREVLETLRERGFPPETIAFWEEAVADCEAEAAKGRQEDPEA